MNYIYNLFFKKKDVKKNMLMSDTTIYNRFYNSNVGLLECFRIDPKTTINKKQIIYAYVEYDYKFMVHIRDTIYSTRYFTKKTPIVVGYLTRRVEFGYGDNLQTIDYFMNEYGIETEINHRVCSCFYRLHRDGTPFNNIEPYMYFSSDECGNPIFTKEQNANIRQLHKIM